MNLAFQNHWIPVLNTVDIFINQIVYLQHISIKGEQKWKIISLWYIQRPSFAIDKTAIEVWICIDVWHGQFGCTYLSYLVSTLLWLPWVNFDPSMYK